MKRTELLSRGMRLLADAVHLHSNSTPQALERGRWNLAVFLSFTAAELLVKGITCLAGYTPRPNHNTADALIRLVDLLERAHRSPFLLTASTRHGISYSLWSDGSTIRLCRAVSGVYTQIGGTRPPDVHLARITLDLRIDRNGIAVLSQGVPLLRTTGSVDSEQIRLRRHFVVPESLPRMKAVAERLKDLRSHRESALYATSSYTETQAGHARQAVADAMALVEEFAPLVKT